MVNRGRCVNNNIDEWRLSLRVTSDSGGGPQKDRCLRTVVLATVVSGKVLK